MRTFLRRIATAMTAAAMVAAGIAGITATTASPALAADNLCTQKFPTPLGSGPYTYNRGPYTWANKNASPAGATKMLLDIDGPYTTDGAAAHLWHNYNGASQYWCMAPTGAHDGDGHNYWKLRNYYTGECLDIAGPSDVSGTLVHQWGCDRYWDNTSQWWAQIPANGGSMFRNVYSGKCLDAQNWGNQDGTLLQIWTCGDTSKANQIFF